MDYLNGLYGIPTVNAKRKHTGLYVFVALLVIAAAAVAVYFAMTKSSNEEKPVLRVSYELNGVASPGVSEGWSDVSGRNDSLPELYNSDWTFAGWYKESEYIHPVKTYGDLPPNGDVRLYAKWLYRISFEMNGRGLQVSDEIRTKGASGSITVPREDANRKFAGWYTVNEVGGVFNDEYAVSDYSRLTFGDVKLFAKWTMFGTYRVTFDLNDVVTLPAEAGPNRITDDKDGGVVVYERTGYEGDSLMPAPRSPFYDFRGWYTSNGDVSPFDPQKYVPNWSSSLIPWSDITLYARWDYTITFITGGVSLSSVPAGWSSVPGGYACASTLFASGALPQQTDIGDTPGYTLQGWYREETYVNGVTDYFALTSGHATLYARWSDAYTGRLSFNLNGVATLPADGGGGNGFLDGKFGDTPVIYNLTGTETGALPTPRAEGFEFDGWFETNSASGVFTGNRVYNFSDVAGRNLSLYARWSYRVTFTMNGAGVSIESAVIYKGQSGSLPSQDAAGWRLVGWYLQNGVNGAFDESQRVTDYSSFGSSGNTRLYARWDYTVTFDMSGVSDSVLRTDKTKGAFGALSDPVNYPAARWTFDGWYKNGGSNVFDLEDDKITDYSQITTGSVILYAKWLYRVTFELNGVTASAPYRDRTKGESGAIPAPTAVQGGWTFAGWYAKNGAAGVFDEGERINDYSSLNSSQTASQNPGNLTLYAKWTYTITFNKNGKGNASLPAENIVKDAVFVLPEPGTQSGYVFVGWYLDDVAFMRKVTSSADFSAGNVTVHAKWVEAFV